MKKTILGALAAALLGGAAALVAISGDGDRPSAGNLQALAVGPMAGLDIIAAPAPAPDIAFIDATGAPRTLGDYRGKVVLVNLWATWCAPCVQEMPALDRLAAAVAEQDFALLPLSLDIDGTQTVQAFYDKHGIRHLPVLVDKTGRSPAAFGAAGLPFTALIDAEGRLVARHAGDAEWDSAAARAVIDALIGK